MTALKVSVGIKTPGFITKINARTLSPSARQCATEGCVHPAAYILGHYLVGERQVRVWVCEYHDVGNPNQVLPTPKNIIEGLRIEQEYIAAQERKYRWRDGTPEKSVSVKVLSSTGHGPALHGDRVASFRWEPTPADLIARTKRLKKKAKVTK